jgi:hypothetical protein
MGKTPGTIITSANSTIYRPGQKAGHYESFFLRANHPQKPLAFWIRYTIFSPQGHPDKAIGELWAVFFDGENKINTAVKKEVPFDQCSFNAAAIDNRVGDAILKADKLIGGASAHNHEITWDLNYTGTEKPLFLLPLKMYSAGFPRAKSCVPLPLATFSGMLKVDGKEIRIDKWVGSQNHNWGSKHTDLYAWGQVAGFDKNPDTFLEVATAKVKIGPFWTPRMTTLVLRHRGKEYALNSLTQMLYAHGEFNYFNWQFGSVNGEIGISGRIWADRASFAGLNYYNPPGGSKYCLNTKLAACHLKITHPHGSSEFLTTDHRAAFEILTDKKDHGIVIQV